MKRTDKLFEVFEARFRCGFGASGGEVLQVGTEGLGGGFDGAAGPIRGFEEEVNTQKTT